MDMEQISKEQLGWLAGIIDGEGCISVGMYTRTYPSTNNHKRTRSTYTILQSVLTISNHDVRLIKRVSEIYKKLNVGFFYSTAKKKDGNTWVININTTGKGSAYKVLQAVKDHLVSKKDQMEVFLDLVDYRRSLGYRTPKDGFKICDNPKIQEYVKRLRELKHEFPSLPPETRRRANQILEID